jgi:hypothetical protein
MNGMTLPTDRRSRLTRQRAAAVIAAVALALTATACGGDDDDAGAGSGDAPTVEITTPADGDQVGASFDVQLALNFPIGEPETGRDHVHLYYDGNMTEGEYGIAYAETFTVEGLSPGPHTIQAIVAHADHSLTDARSAEVSVEVGGSGAGAGPSDTNDSSGTTTATTALAYDY